MIAFCKDNGGFIKSLRNNSVMPASAGIYSDVFYSAAYKMAAHHSQHGDSQA
jgi:hypothetical protein